MPDKGTQPDQTRLRVTVATGGHQWRLVCTPGKREEMIARLRQLSLDPDSGLQPEDVTAAASLLNDSFGPVGPSHRGTRTA